VRNVVIGPYSVEDSFKGDFGHFLYIIEAAPIATFDWQDMTSPLKFYSDL